MDQEMVRSEIVQRVLENHHIEWKFSLALVSWWGRFYERMVGLLKDHLRRPWETQDYGELEVLITQVEASLNNRPLSYQGEDIETALTPAQLMYGYDLPEITEQELEEEYVETDVHKRMRYMQKMKEHLWNRWKNDYLTALR